MMMMMIMITIILIIVVIGMMMIMMIMITILRMVISLMKITTMKMTMATITITVTLIMTIIIIMTIIQPKYHQRIGILIRVPCNILFIPLSSVLQHNECDRKMVSVWNRNVGADVVVRSCANYYM